MSFNVIIAVGGDCKLTLGGLVAGRGDVVPGLDRMPLNDCRLLDGMRDVGFGFEEEELGLGLGDALELFEEGADLGEVLYALTTGDVDAGACALILCLGPGTRPYCRSFALGSTETGNFFFSLVLERTEPLLAQESLTDLSSKAPP